MQPGYQIQCPRRRGLVSTAVPKAKSIFLMVQEVSGLQRRRWFELLLVCHCAGVALKAKWPQIALRPTD
jgi:hypothetical protein